MIAFAAGATAYVGLEALGVAGASLWAGAVAGFCCATRLRPAQVVPAWARALALSVVGCSAGAMVSRDVLGHLRSHPLEAIGGVAATLVVTMAAGQLLLLSPAVDRMTAALASIAGGASGVSAVSGELGADERIVLAVQYLRVVLVLGSIPVAVAIFAAPGHRSAGPEGAAGSWWASAGVVVVSLVLAHWIRFPASGLLLPMLLAGVVSVSEVVPTVLPPAAAQEGGFAVIGLMVGIAFDRETIRTLRRIAPLALAQAVLGMLGCLVAAYVLARTSGLSMIDAYLATSPGGLPAVLAAAVSVGGNVGVITAMQVARVVLSLALAPLIGRILPPGSAHAEAA